MSVIEARSSTAPPLPRAASCVLVLLAGGTAPSPIARVLGCSLLDLEVAPGRTLLHSWATRDWCPPGQERVVRTTRGSGSPAPAMTSALLDPAPGSSRAPTIEHFVDQAGPRGSAGGLLDVCRNDEPDTTIIAAECSTAFLAPLEPVLAAHHESGADATLVVTRDDLACGLAVVRRSALESVKPRGYVDFKEQFLPALLKSGKRVHVAHADPAHVIGMHDRRGVLAGLHRLAALENPSAPNHPPTHTVDPRWSPPIISPDAQVDPSAVVSASLVMAGARIGARACVARCIIGPGAIVRPGQIVVERIVTRNRDWEDEHIPLEQRRGSW